MDRIKIKNKFNGRCAYCGEILKDRFHVDHIQSKRTGGLNVDDNYYPACQSCNIRKSTLSIEQFRKEIKRDIIQLRRDSAKFRTLERFGLIFENKIEIVFYYEKANNFI